MEKLETIQYWNKQISFGNHNLHSTSSCFSPSFSFPFTLLSLYFFPQHFWYPIKITFILYFCLLLLSLWECKLHQNGIFVDFAYWRIYVPRRTLGTTAMLKNYILKEKKKKKRTISWIRESFIKNFDIKFNAAFHSSWTSFPHVKRRVENILKLTIYMNYIYLLFSTNPVDS